MTSTSTALVLEGFYAHPIERVWRLLTDPAAIAGWLMPNDFVARLGHRFTFRTEPIPAVNFDGIIHCEVTALEPPHLLAYSWSNDQLNTTVSYRLEAARQGDVDGTRLRFEHAGFDLDKPSDRAAYNGMAGGWRTLIASGLAQALDEAAASG